MRTGQKYLNTSNLLPHLLCSSRINKIHNRNHHQTKVKKQEDQSDKKIIYRNKRNSTNITFFFQTS